MHLVEIFTIDISSGQLISLLILSTSGEGHLRMSKYVSDHLAYCDKI